MGIPFRGWLEGPHEVDRDLLERIALVDGHEGVPLSLRVSVPGLTDPTPVDEVLSHLLESGEVEVSAYPGKSCSDPHVSAFLGMGMEEYFGDHLVGDANLNLFFPKYIGIRTDEDASRVHSELGEDARVAPN